MARITQRQLSEIRRALGKMDATTDRIVTEVIQEVGLADVETLRNALMTKAKPIARISASNAERVARATYNAMRKAGVGKTMLTEAAGSWNEGKFDAAVNTAVKKAGEGATAEQVANILKGRMRYDNKRAYGETIRRNASIDPLRPRYARVPGTTSSYSDGCPFCRMLASRGFVYANKDTAGEFDHYHADCSCTVVASWDKNPKADGYDPDAYYQEYEDARAYAAANVDELRERETVGVKEFARYDSSGKKVGTRMEDYSTAAHVQANDMAAAYRDLGMEGRAKKKRK